VFDPSVDDARIDEEHLQRVLEFNEQGGGRSPSPKKSPKKAEGETSPKAPASKKRESSPKKLARGAPSPKKRKDDVPPT
jgi:hypothetical protein